MDKELEKCCWITASFAICDEEGRNKQGFAEQLFNFSSFPFFFYL
jgi:hypothetical protein